MHMGYLSLSPLLSVTAVPIFSERDRENRSTFHIHFPLYSLFCSCCIGSVVSVVTTAIVWFSK